MHCELCSGKRAIKPTHHPLPHILLQFSHKSTAPEHPAPLSHIITRLGQQDNTRFHESMDYTASLCLRPRVSECGSIDEVLLNIKMRIQIKGIIAGAGRIRPGLVGADMLRQANNMFRRLMNELQGGDGNEGVDLGDVYGR